MVEARQLIRGRHSYPGFCAGGYREHLHVVMESWRTERFRLVAVPDNRVARCCPACVSCSDVGCSEAGEPDGLVIARPSPRHDD